MESKPLNRHHRDNAFSMRVILLNQAFYPDHAATAQHAHDLARHLVRQGHEVAVITSRSLYGQKGASLPRFEQIEGIEVHRVGASLFGKSSILARILDFALFYVLATLKALRLRRADVIVPFTTPPFIALVGLLLRAVKGTRVVYWLMDLYPDLPVACGVMKRHGWTTALLERLHRFCLRRVDRVVVLGRCMKQLVLDKAVPAERIEQIGVWADHTEVTPLPREDNPYRAQWDLAGKFVVMYSGNFGLGHDVETLCGAIERLRDRDDIRFLCVGGGKRLEELRRFIEQAKVTNVQVHPYQPREKLDALLSLADVHLISLAAPVCGIMVPSKLFGILAAARPSIFVGPTGSEIARVLAESDAGLTVSNGDAEALAQAIRALQADPARAQAMGDRARQALIERYDRAHACAAWERLLRRLVPPAPAATAAAATPVPGTKDAP